MYVAAMETSRRSARNAAVVSAGSAARKSSDRRGSTAS